VNRSAVLKNKSNSAGNFKMKFLITAGGTRERIDPVRFISNDSSGKMGYALAEAAVGGGHEVVLVTAADLKSVDGVREVAVESAGDMFEAVKKEFEGCDCLIMAAAVSDYTPASPAKNKIKKSDDSMLLVLKATKDILKWAGEHKRQGQIVVGFALEDKDVHKRAEGKLESKKLDMIIANTPAAIGADKSCVEIKTPMSQWRSLPVASKAENSRKIIEAIEQL